MPKLILCILQLNICLCSKIGDYSHVVNHSRLAVLEILNSDLYIFRSISVGLHSGHIAALPKDVFDPRRVIEMTNEMKLVLSS